ncbi:hypothetical protein SAMN05444380_104108 [Thermophagus xiamenensis]|uniref:Uncharacterized protein n=1 Tax=Thermophagus xiamenensis TaxID=385682 RepID=A0A1I1WHL7_9BACT|nr:hypothetical protein SAMN05444380_104108 [Thermophagus xiamenensis]
MIQKYDKKPKSPNFQKRIKKEQLLSGSDGND